MSLLFMVVRGTGTGALSMQDMVQITTPADEKLRSYLMQEDGDWRKTNSHKQYNPAIISNGTLLTRPLLASH